MAETRDQTVVVGAGVAGLVACLGLLDCGLPVMLIDRCEPQAIGGLGLHAFGGMTLVNTPLQRLNGIRDSKALALSDWLRFAEFGAADVWPKLWAERYVDRCLPDV